MNNLQACILHVEDDPNDIVLVQRAFRKANLLATLQTIQDGDTAVSYLNGESIYRDREQYPLPTLILLDLKIPRRSGLELLSWLRQQPRLRRIPVTILTSSRHEIDVNRAYDLGVNSYLVKPVSFEALLRMAKAVNAYWLSLSQRPTLSLE